MSSSWQSFLIQQKQKVANLERKVLELEIAREEDNRRIVSRFGKKKVVIIVIL